MLLSFIVAPIDPSRGRVEVGEGGGTDWGGVEGWGENADHCNRIKNNNNKIKSKF